MLSRWGTGGVADGCFVISKHRLASLAGTRSPCCRLLDDRGFEAVRAGVSRCRNVTRGGQFWPPLVPRMFLAEIAVLILTAIPVKNWWAILGLNQ